MGDQEFGEEREMGVSVVGELKQSFSARKGVRQSFRATHGGEW